MSRWTTDEILEGLGNSPDIASGRVHAVAHVPFAGQAGHHYVLRGHREPSDRDLARTSRQSHHSEVALTRINDTYILYVGNTHIAIATLWIPRLQEGIESFEWIAHTHPLEQEDALEGVARGPTPADRRALRQVHTRWGQESSRVVVCRAGSVVGEPVTFRVSDEDDPLTRPGRGIWTPDGR